MAQRHGTVVLAWGDGEFSFCFGLRELGELEERRGGIGVWTIRNRLQDASCTTKDVTETLRLGLIGGGMTPVEALGKVAFYGEGRPIEESRLVAYMALTASMLRLPGQETDTSGEAGAAGTNASTSPPSSEPPPPSA